MSEPTELLDPPEAPRRRKPSARPKGRVTMTDIARAAGCSQATVSFVLNNSPGIRRGISALIYMTIFTREITAPDFLYGLDIPVILLNCYTADYAFPAVVPSEIAGGQNSTRHLISNGHRRIATITGEPWMQAAQDRLKGYRRALATADIPFDPGLVVEGDWSASAGYAATVKLLALKDRPTAIFCQNDGTAIGCYEALKDAGLHIP